METARSDTLGTQRVSHKNLLQEWCQRRRAGLPRYESLLLSSGNTTNAWSSTVTLDPSLYMRAIHGNARSTKVEAEQSAAELALQLLVELFRKKAIYASFPTCILIDAENRPDAYLELAEHLQGYSLHFFATKGHPSLRPIIPTPEHTVVEVSSTRRDAVDVAMSMHLALYISKGKYFRYIVITGDHFGACLPECVDDGFLKHLSEAYKCFTIKHYPSASAFLEEERC